MILLMTLAQQLRRSPKRVIATRSWSLKATVAALWAAALLVVVTSCGVLAAVAWVLLAPPETVAEAPGKADEQASERASEQASEQVPSNAVAQAVAARIVLH